MCVRGVSLTLNDGQQDDDDEEEEGDVKDHTVQLVLISCWVFDLVTNTPTSSHAHVHVEQIALRKGEREWEREISI